MRSGFSRADMDAVLRRLALLMVVGGSIPPSAAPTARLPEFLIPEKKAGWTRLKLRPRRMAATIVRVDGHFGHERNADAGCTQIGTAENPVIMVVNEGVFL
jgi:hypothetical protein